MVGSIWLGLLTMSLKLGEWKMNDNGVEGTFHIINVNPNSREVSGMIGQVGVNVEQAVGVWDETSRTIIVASPLTLEDHRWTAPAPSAARL